MVAEDRKGEVKPASCVKRVGVRVGDWELQENSMAAGRQELLYAYVIFFD